MTEKVKIKVYSDSENPSHVLSALYKTGSENLEVTISDSKIINPENDEIVIIHISSGKSMLGQKLIEAQSIFSSKFIVILEEEDALLISCLAKAGINNIFLLNHELIKYNTYIENLISNIPLNQDLETDFENEEYDLKWIIGKSRDAEKKLNLARKVSENKNISVLILGETGTGKGLLAKAIHQYNNPKNSPFVDVFCTAIPANLLESELFGYEQGAFTDAKAKKPGLFEIAEDGTVFLDEIGDLNLDLQAKLLRVTENKSIRRIGGIKDIPYKARIISATNCNLRQMVEDKLFRKDLFYRLNVATIELSPLRERREEIKTLTHHFVSLFSNRYNKKTKRIDGDVLSFICSYNWPGNIRELRNYIERAVLLSEGGIINLKNSKSLTINDEVQVEIQNNHFLDNKLIFDVDINSVNLNEMNRKFVREVLKALNGNKTTAAKVLGISRPKLDRLLLLKL